MLGARCVVSTLYRGVNACAKWKKPQLSEIHLWEDTGTQNGLAGNSGDHLVQCSCSSRTTRTGFPVHCCQVLRIVGLHNPSVQLTPVFYHLHSQCSFVFRWSFTRASLSPWPLSCLWKHTSWARWVICQFTESWIRCEFCDSVNSHCELWIHGSCMDTAISLMKKSVQSVWGELYFFLLFSLPLSSILSSLSGKPRVQRCQLEYIEMHGRSEWGLWGSYLLVQHGKDATLDICRSVRFLFQLYMKGEYNQCFRQTCSASSQSGTEFVPWWFK